MQRKVTPAMVIVAVIVVVAVIGGIWYFTMGKSGKKGSGSGDQVDSSTMQPKTPEEAAARGYKPQPTGGPPPGGQQGMGGPPSGRRGR